MLYFDSLRYYVRDAGRAVIAFFLGAVFTLSTMVLGWSGVQIPGKYSGAAAQIGGMLLMIYGQFIAYHKLRVKYLATESRDLVSIRRWWVAAELAALPGPNSPTQAIEHRWSIEVRLILRNEGEQPTEFLCPYIRLQRRQNGSSVDLLPFDRTPQNAHRMKDVVHPVGGLWGEARIPIGSRTEAECPFSLVCNLADPKTVLDQPIVLRLNIDVIGQRAIEIEIDVPIITSLDRWFHDESQSLDRNQIPH